jgi:hypothetical protein
VILEHNDRSTAMAEVNNNDEEQTTTVTTSRSTPKRKSLFHNIERKNIKNQRFDNFGFVREEIVHYLNDDENDLNTFILFEQSAKYKTLN